MLRFETLRFDRDRSMILVDDDATDDDSPTEIGVEHFLTAHFLPFYQEVRDGMRNEIVAGTRCHSASVSGWAPCCCRLASDRVSRALHTIEGEAAVR